MSHMVNPVAATWHKSRSLTNTLNLLEMRHYSVGGIVLSCSLIASEESGEETYHYYEVIPWLKRLLIPFNQLLVIVT